MEIHILLMPNKELLTISKLRFAPNIGDRIRITKDSNASLYGIVDMEFVIVEGQPDKNYINVYVEQVSDSDYEDTTYKSEPYRISEGGSTEDAEYWEKRNKLLPEK